QPSVEFDQFDNADLPWKRRRLQSHADPAFEPAGIPSRIDPENGKFTLITRAQSFEDFNRGAFAGAVWPEHGKDLTRLDLEVDALHGSHVAVTLLQPTHLDDGLHGGGF